MEWHQVKQWLDKYYEGACTLEEEKMLKEALINKDVPPELQADKLMFESMADYSNELDPEFDAEALVHKAIDREEHKSRFFLKPATQWLVRIAAVFVIAAGGYL